MKKWEELSTIQRDEIIDKIGWVTKPLNADQREERYNEISNLWDTLVDIESWQDEGEYLEKEFLKERKSHGE
jgi:hypothetical protein